MNSNMKKELEDLSAQVKKIHIRSGIVEFWLIIIGIPVTILSLAFHGGIFVISLYWFYVLWIPIKQENQRKKLVQIVKDKAQNGNKYAIILLSALKEDQLKRQLENELTKMNLLEKETVRVDKFGNP